MTMPPVAESNWKSLLSKPQSMRQQLTKSFLGVGSMYMLGQPITFLTSIILARNLGPTAFGQYAFVMSLLAVFSLPVAGGFPQLLTREVADYSHTGQWPLYRGSLRVAHIWVFVVGFMIIAAFFLLKKSGLISVEGKWAFLSIIVLIVPLQGFNTIRTGAIRGLGYPALAELPNQTIRLLLFLACISVLSACNVLSTQNALWAQVAAVTITFIVTDLIFRRIEPQCAYGYTPEYKIKQWLHSLLPFTLITVVGTLNAQIGILLLGIFGTNDAVGALRIADRGAQFVYLSLALVNLVISPHIVRTWKDGDKNQLQQLSRQSARRSFALALLIGLILIIFGRPLICIVFGEAYVNNSYWPMVILVIGQLFNVAMGSVGILLVMSGKERYTLIGHVAGLVITVAIAPLLIQLYQANGAAIAVCIGLITWNFALGVAVFKKIKIKLGIL